MLDSCSAVATDSLKSVFCGGLSSANQASRRVAQFDGKRWKALSSMKVARCGAAALFYEGAGWLRCVL